MIKSEKKISELVEILRKKDNLIIAEAINMLRQEKPFEGAIGLLTAFYDNTNDNPIRKTISEFMNDLKDQSVSMEVIEEIRKEWKPDTISMLISSCWQSGLDYSDYSLDMAKIFLKADYVTAIECLTVIEETVEELSAERKSELIKLITDNPISRGNEKSTLTHELISILER